MTVISQAIQYQFAISGKAVSFRSGRRAKDYRRKIAKVARKLVRRPYKRRQVDVWLDYFYVGGKRPDMDNIAKCVLDGLTGIAYKDDRQVRDQSAACHDLSQPLTLQGGPIDLVKPLMSFDQYLFVRIRVVAPSRRSSDR